MEIDKTPRSGGIKKIVYVSLDEIMNHSCVVNSVFFLGKIKIWTKVFMYKLNTIHLN